MCDGELGGKGGSWNRTVVGRNMELFVSTLPSSLLSQQILPFFVCTQTNKATNRINK